MQSIAKTASLIYGVTVVLLFALAFLVGCGECDSGAQSSDSEEGAAAMGVTDLPRGYLPVLNLDALSGEMATPEGVSGGLMSHQWEVEGEVAELDKKNDVAVLSVDVEDPYFRYLNNPVAFSVDSRPEIVVGDRVRMTFLPPGSEETIIRPNNLTVLSKAQ